MNVLKKSYRIVVAAGTGMLAMLAPINVLGTDFTRTLTTATGNAWWAPGEWSPGDWVNGAGNRATVANHAGDGTVLTLAQPVVANAFSFSGGGSTTLAPATPESPESFTLAGNDQTLAVSFASQDNEFVIDVPFSGNDVTLYSIGAGEAGGGYTGGVTFGPVPTWDSLTVRSGTLLFRQDAAFYDLYPLYANTVILDGGGICTRNYGFSGMGSGDINFPIKVGPAGGWFRCWGNGVLHYNGILSDAAPGNAGMFRHTDGGSFHITNTLAGFSGTLRNEAGTMTLSGAAALGFPGRLEQGDDASLLSLGDYEDLAGATHTLPMSAIAVQYGSFCTSFDNGTVVIPCPMSLHIFYDQIGSSVVCLTGAHARTFCPVLYDVGGGLELAEGSIATPASAPGMVLFAGSGASKTILQRSGTEWLGNGSGAFDVNAGSAVTQEEGAVLNALGGALNVNHGTFIQRGTASFGAVSLDEALLVVTNGTFNAHGIQIGVPGRGGVAELRMDAGEIVVGAGGLNRRASDTGITFNGGTLASAAPFAMPAAFTVGGDVTIDTTGGDITQTGLIDGMGTLTITGGNTFSATDVQVAVEIADGTLMPGTTQGFSLPALTTTSAAATLGVQLASSPAGASSKYTVSGDITLADGTQFDISLYQGDVANDQPYILMETTGGTITANPATFHAPLVEQSRSSVAFSLSGNGKQLLMTVTKAAATLYWKGAGDSGTWDTAAVAWSQNAGATVADETFYPLDDVVFNDMPGQSLVTVAMPGAIVPASVTVANADTDFALTGAGISGSATLVKTGTGTFIHEAPWLSTGTLAVNGGTLDWRTPGAHPVSLFSVAGGATLKLNTPSASMSATANLWGGANLHLGAGTFTVSESSQLNTLGTLTLGNGTLVTSSGNLTKDIALGGGTTGMLDMRSISGSMSGKISGAGDLIFAGSGSLADDGGGNGDSILFDNPGNDFTGTITLASGVTKAESNFGNPANAIVLNGGGTVSTSNPITLDRDLFIGPNGGVLRCWGADSRQQIWTKAFADLVPGTGGTVSHTDGGIIRFTGDISGFTGNYRKAATDGGSITYIGDGSALPCDEMRWRSIYINGSADKSVTFDFANAAFNAGFSTTGNGAIRKRGTGTLLFTNNVESAIAHTGGTFIENGALSVASVNQFADGTEIYVAEGTVLEQRALNGLPDTAARRLSGAGTFSITLTADGGNTFYNNGNDNIAATGFTGLLDLHATGSAMLTGFHAARLAPGATMRINPGALLYAQASFGTDCPYNLQIAGTGNEEPNADFGAIRAESVTFSGDIALIGDARLFGSATYTGTISNDCGTAKTLTFGGASEPEDPWIVNIDGLLTDGTAPLSLALDRADATLNISGDDNRISGTLTVSAGTVNIAAGNTQVGGITNDAAIAVADGATLQTTGIGTGTGAYTFEGASVLGIIITEQDSQPLVPHLTAQTLTFPDTAKIDVTGIGLIDQDARFRRNPLLTFPSAAFAGLPELTAPLPKSWSLFRRENNDGTATLFLSRQVGTTIILR